MNLKQEITLDFLFVDCDSNLVYRMVLNQGLTSEEDIGILRLRLGDEYVSVESAAKIIEA